MSCRLVHCGGRPDFFPTGSSGSSTVHCASVRSARPATSTLATRSPVYLIVLVDDRSTGDLVYLINDTPTPPRTGRRPAPQAPASGRFGLAQQATLKQALRARWIPGCGGWIRSDVLTHPRDSACRLCPTRPNDLPRLTRVADGPGSTWVRGHRRSRVNVSPPGGGRLDPRVGQD